MEIGYYLHILKMETGILFKVIVLMANVNVLCGFVVNAKTRAADVTSSARSHNQYIPDFIVQCFSETNISLCFKRRALDVLDRAISDNRTWHISDSVVAEKVLDWSPEGNWTDSNNLDAAVVGRVKDLIESRALRVKVGTTSSGEGRKKDKGGKGGIAMMGILGLAGVLAQIMMGKIAMVAGTALLLSKVALILSILSSFKKSSAPSSKDHVIYSDPGGSSGGITSGWQRSIYRPAPTDEEYEPNRINN